MKNSVKQSSSWERARPACSSRRPAAILVYFALSASLFVSGCKDEERGGQGTASAAGSIASASVQPEAPKGQPQPKLPTLNLWVGTNQVAAEICQTLDQIHTGMMFRTKMAEMDGMLFVFPQPQRVAFYMKNTLIPLSCAYIDSEGNILETYDMEPLNETPIPARSDQVQYVLEMKQGWFERHNIRPGVAIATERGTFPQTFRRR